MSPKELGVGTGGDLTELLSHIYASHHLDLFRSGNCSDDLCIVLDGRYALCPPCKLTYSDDTDQRVPDRSHGHLNSYTIRGFYNSGVPHDLTKCKEE